MGFKQARDRLRERLDDFYYDGPRSLVSLSQGAGAFVAEQVYTSAGKLPFIAFRKVFPERHEYTLTQDNVEELEREKKIGSSRLMGLFGGACLDIAFLVGAASYALGDRSNIASACAAVAGTKLITHATSATLLAGGRRVRDLVKLRRLSYNSCE